MIMALVVFTSCENDLVSAPPYDDGIETGDTSGNIVGTWNLVSYSSIGSTTTTTQGVTIEADIVGQGSDYNLVLEFSENPASYSMLGSYDVELSTTVNGETVVTNENDVDDTSNGAWSKEDNSLILADATSNLVKNVSIQILSETRLKYSYTIEESFAQQDVTNVSTISKTFTFERE